MLTLWVSGTPELRSVLTEMLSDWLVRITRNKVVGFFVFNDFREFRDMREINYSERCVRVTTESNSSDNTANTKKNKSTLI